MIFILGLWKLLCTSYHLYDHTDLQFIVNGNNNAPTVTTTTPTTNISFYSATTGGNVSSIGASAITERGVCYGTSSNPTTAGSKVEFIPESGTTGSFSVDLSGLSANTLYHYRAYAINASGTSYGTDQTFTTLTDFPTITTLTPATNISFYSATTGGNVSSIGASAITERGVCYGTSSNPTTAGSKVEFIPESGTIGSFSVNLSGLTMGTTYHFRAYATNASGTSYG